MSKPKHAYGLTPRPRCYPTAEECAAEFSVSVQTWSKWVANGTAPPPIPTSPQDLPRWRWSDVDTWFAEPASRQLILARYGDGEPAAAPQGGLAAARDTGNVQDQFLAGVKGMVDGSPQRRRRRGSAL